MFRMTDNSTGHLVRVSQEFGYGTYQITINQLNGTNYVHLNDERKKKLITLEVGDFQELVEISSSLVKEIQQFPKGNKVSLKRKAEKESDRENAPPIKRLKLMRDGNRWGNILHLPPPSTVRPNAEPVKRQPMSTVQLNAEPVKRLPMSMVQLNAESVKRPPAFMAQPIKTSPIFQPLHAEPVSPPPASTVHLNAPILPPLHAEPVSPPPASTVHLNAPILQPLHAEPVSPPPTSTVHPNAPILQSLLAKTYGNVFGTLTPQQTVTHDWVDEWVDF